MRLEDHTDEDWQKLMDVNLRGMFYGCKHAVLRFRAQGGGGCIVNTGSVAGIVGWGGTVYGVSKAGVNHLTKAVAMECASDDIRANAICPAGMPGTNFMSPQATEGSQGVSEEQTKMVGQIHPLGRPVTADDIAAAAVYLASDEAINVTGVLLPVDGGYIAR
jgi:NAD(P)-dependent dehydrogenase (short-subunit alcohol dehydrogenase family)